MKKVKINTLFNDIEMPLTVVLADMESEGIVLDIEMLSNYSKELSIELDPNSLTLTKFS